MVLQSRGAIIEIYIQKFLYQIYKSEEGFFKSEGGYGPLGPHSSAPAHVWMFYDILYGYLIHHI